MHNVERNNRIVLLLENIDLNSSSTLPGFQWELNKWDECIWNRFQRSTEIN